MGHKHFRDGLDVQAAMPDVSNDADHRKPGTGDDAYALTYRVLIGPERPRHGFVDDDYRRGLWIIETCRIRLLIVIPDHRQSDPRVSVTEKSAFPQWYHHRPEVVVADTAEGGARLLPGRRRGAPLYMERNPILTSGERGL